MHRSNQLSYEATDVGSWSFVSSNEPVKNGCEVIYEMFHIVNCGFEMVRSSMYETFHISLHIIITIATIIVINIIIIIVFEVVVEIV